MKFVLLFGPQAVGKMTVGQELARITGLKLLHNHMTIALLELFSGLARKCGDYRPYSVRRYFFTFVWAFNKKENWDAVEKAVIIFVLKARKYTLLS